MTVSVARLGFIGCGSFATSRIFPQIPLIPEIDLVGVCDIVREKAERNARNFGARRVYTDLHQMLDHEKLDEFAMAKWECVTSQKKIGLPQHRIPAATNMSGVRAGRVWATV